MATAASSQVSRLDQAIAEIIEAMRAVHMTVSEGVEAALNQEISDLAIDNLYRGCPSSRAFAAAVETVRARILGGEGRIAALTMGLLSPSLAAKLPDKESK